MCMHVLQQWMATAKRTLIKCNREKNSKELNEHQCCPSTINCKTHRKSGWWLELGAFCSICQKGSPILREKFHLFPRVVKLTRCNKKSGRKKCLKSGASDMKRLCFRNNHNFSSIPGERKKLRGGGVGEALSGEKQDFFFLSAKCSPSPWELKVMLSQQQNRKQLLQAPRHGSERRTFDKLEAQQQFMSCFIAHSGPTYNLRAMCYRGYNDQIEYF